MKKLRTVRNWDAYYDRKHALRLRNEARYEARREKLEEAAESMIGQLCREGATVYYVAPIGGRYREGSKLELVDFLIRNHHVAA